MKLFRGQIDRLSLKNRLWSLLEKISGPIRIVGILMSVLSMHLLVVRPLVDRVGRLESELHGIDTTLQKIAKSRTTIRQTNSLLENLKSQHEELARARATVHQLQILRKEIAYEAEQIPAALESLKRLSELSDYVFQSEVKRYSQLPAALKEEVSPAQPSSLSVPIRIEDMLSDTELVIPDPIAPRIVTIPRKLIPISQQKKMK